MIFDRHIHDQLTAYLDGEMAVDVRARAETHLATCGVCHEEVERIRAVAAILEQMPLAAAPDHIWTAIQTAAAAAPQQTRQLWRYAAAAAAIFIAVVVVALWPRATWQVTISGRTQNIPNGRWIETNAAAAARIKIADIGSVDVEPSTRVRLVETGAAGHRLALESGAISAKITAPPRLFFVDTPAGTAVDLGCEYRLHCDRTGDGLLRVSAGWVAFQWEARESLVPAGASCRVRSGRGPGTPWFNDASPRFVEALHKFDSGHSELPVILAEARARDTLTLWHLLSRVETTERALIYDRMVSLAPPPGGVIRDRILSLDKESLTRWKNELAWIW